MFCFVLLFLRNCRQNHLIRKLREKYLYLMQFYSHLIQLTCYLAILGVALTVHPVALGQYCLLVPYKIVLKTERFKELKQFKENTSSGSRSALYMFS